MKTKHPSYPKPRLTPSSKRAALDILEGVARRLASRHPAVLALSRERTRLGDVAGRHLSVWGGGGWRRRGEMDQSISAMAEEMVRDTVSRERQAWAKVEAEHRAWLGCEDDAVIIAIARKRLVRAALAAPVDALADRKPGSILVRQAKAQAQRDEAVRRHVAALVSRAYGEATYRRAESAWVGGENSVVVDLGAPTVYSRTDTVWHKRHTWRGSNLTVKLTVPRHWEKSVLGRGLAVVEERLTLAASPILTSDLEEAYEATWVEQSRGLSLVPSSGILYRRRSHGAGSAWLPWVHAQSLRGARAVTSRLSTLARAS